MKNDRQIAIVVGVLFIFASVFFVLGQTLASSILESPNLLSDAYADRSTLMAGILLELAAALAIPLIPVFLHAVLKRYDETLSLGYLVFRTLECVLILVSIVGSLSVIGLAQLSVANAGVDAVQLRSAADVILLASEWSFALSVVVFSLDALMLNWILYRSKLAPRLISVWGLVGAAWLLAGSVLILFEAVPGISETQQELLFASAIAVNEMVLAAWLILKGFATSASSGQKVAAGERRRKPVAATELT